MQLGGRVGGYRKKGNNKAIDDYRVNPIGQRNHPRITVTLIQAIASVGVITRKGGSDISETLRVHDPYMRSSCVLTLASTLIRDFTHHLFFYRNATTRASRICTALYTPTSLSSQFTHEFSLDERRKR